MILRFGITQCNTTNSCFWVREEQAQAHLSCGHQLLERYTVLVENANAANRDLLDEIGQSVSRAETLKRA